MPSATNLRIYECNELRLPDWIGGPVRLFHAGIDFVVRLPDWLGRPARLFQAGIYEFTNGAAGIAIKKPFSYLKMAF